MLTDQPLTTEEQAELEALEALVMSTRLPVLCVGLLLFVWALVLTTGVVMDVFVWYITGPVALAIRCLYVFFAVVSWVLVACLLWSGLSGLLARGDQSKLPKVAEGQLWFWRFAPLLALFPLLLPFLALGLRDG